MLTPKNLQQRMVLFLLIPVALLLFSMGWFGFRYAQASLLKEWQEAAVLKLQRAAHQVDMRLSEPKLWMQMFSKTGGEPQAEPIRKWIVKQLGQMQGIERATFSGLNIAGSESSQPDRHTMLVWNHKGHGMERWERMMEFDQAEVIQVRLPEHDNQAGYETVSLISNLLSTNNEEVAQLEVVLRFDYLLENVLSHGWERGEMAFLIDSQGNTITCNGLECQQFCESPITFKAVIEAMRKKQAGTIMGDSDATGEIVGFYRLMEVPWTLVLTARDTEILAPINKFRNIFLVSGFSFTMFILLLIRTVAGRTVASVREVSHAAQRVAEGDYQVHLVARRSDEVGQLMDSFNTMVAQLEERMRLKEALDLAMEVQQDLLPRAPFEANGLDIAGTCVYCDETGGIIMTS